MDVPLVSPSHRREHDRYEHDRQHQLERRAISGDAREDGGQQVVDDERHRVRQIEEVRERPDPAVRERGAPSGCGLHERAQPARGDDSTRVREPDSERGSEDSECEHHDEPGGVDPRADCSRQQRQKRDRAADRGDREADEEGRRKRPGGRLRSCQAAVQGTPLDLAARNELRVAHRDWIPSRGVLLASGAHPPTSSREMFGKERSQGVSVATFT